MELVTILFPDDHIPGNCKVEADCPKDSFPLSVERLPNFSNFLVRDDLSIDEMPAEFLELIWNAADPGAAGIEKTWRSHSNVDSSVDPRCESGTGQQGRCVLAGRLSELG
ncbi:hypothetical protein Q0Z83_014900 [Actinoplanes sichuanensis]|nr:hypothetical protein Q0Z83_014900 [Actinoplanes sichuanensis]